MWKNYLKIAFRNLRRNKVFSAINILGLAVGMGVCLLIFQYIHFELSYDRFHPDAERIYRINQTFIWGDNTDHEFASTAPGVAFAVHQEVPEVELITSIHTPAPYIVSYTTPTGEVLAFEENRILAADTNFFRMFNFAIVNGEATAALRHPNTIVMTESTAKKYFGDAWIVYGHTPVTDARFVNQTVNIDTGCVFGGKLTAVRYPEMEIVSVPSQQPFIPEKFTHFD